MNTNKKLVTNTIYLLLSWIVIASFSFLYWLVAGKLLLPEQYGIISTAVNLGVLLGGITMLGLGVSVNKLIPEYLEKKQYKELSATVRFALKTISISNIIFALVIFILSPFLAQILKIPSTVIYIIPIIMTLSAFSNFYGLALRGFQKMKKIAITESIGQFIKFSLSAILIIIGMSYFGPLIGISIGIFITFLLRFKSISLSSITKKINQKYIIFEYALPAFITTLSWILFINGQYVILTAIKTPEITGIFTIAMLLTMPIIVVPKTMSQALFPIISQLNIGRNKKKRQSYLIRMVFRYGLLISLPLMVFVVLFSKQMILIFSRPEYLSASNLFPILAIGSVIYGCGQIFLSSIYAIGKPKIQRNIVILGSVVFLCLSAPLTYLFSATGMCFTYTIAVSVISILSFFYIRKFLQISLAWKSIGKIIFATFIIFSFLFYMIKITEGLILGIISAVITGLIYLTILIPLKFYKKEDFAILNFIAERSPILRKQMKIILDYFSKFAVESD
ncbi:MAG: oligosaccharide flippase family protein [Candidatus Aenigmarchaeota archaeon]|nr:oligosaccharide flippase family protein [Candidatus Aenigmarchaeota archaeon]